MKKIIWFTGHSGSGKTTLALELKKLMDAIILDGDEMRESISLNAGFTREERTEHNLRVARLAKVLSKQTNVIVSVIAPMISVRKEIDKICSPNWIYIKRKFSEREGHFYEESNNYFTLDNLTIKESRDRIKEYLKIGNKKHSLFIGRWQCLPPHEGHLALFDKVRKEGKNILIAIRDTKIDKDNPYSVKERKDTLIKSVPDAKIIVIPDIEEICYGRGVGYGVREIRLEKQIENISATEIRERRVEQN